MDQMLKGLGWFLQSALLLTGVWAGLAEAEQSSSNRCDPQAGMRFVCGPINAEDLVYLPGTQQMIASGMSDTGDGHLYLVDPGTHRYITWYPDLAVPTRWDKRHFADCPGPLNSRQFSAHGLSLLPGEGAVHRLYVTAHGAREAVEVFEVDVSTSTPTIAWVGCVVMPEGDSINSVAALADGGFLTTRISDTGPDSLQQIISGQDSGFLLEWHPGASVRRLPLTTMPAPNGLVLSADEQVLYVGSWGANYVARFIRNAAGELHEDRRLNMDFRVDNLRWSGQGTLLAAGHRLAPADACDEVLCMTHWEVAEIDAELLGKTTLMQQAPVEGFAGATVALRSKSGQGYWMGTFSGDRLVFMQAD